MRGLFTLALAIGLSLAAPPALANAQGDLPDAACNEGTMHAHESVPGTTGTGVMTPGHEHIPELGADGTCAHGD